jgi:putative ABC transport system permease protein
MFNLDRWQEIFEALHKNKLRTFLTGLSVASGIFILVILLGFGQGMQNGISKEFEGDASNLIWIWAQVTTKEYKGLNPGRRIRLENSNYDYISTLFKDRLEYKSRMLWVRLENGTMNYKKESGSYGVRGVDPDMQYIENMKIISGRFLNYSDLNSNNKVVVISNKIKQELIKGVEAVLNL